VTHNEAISIADYFTVRDKKGEVTYRPTCHYAYHPCNDAVLSLNEMFGAAGKAQPVHHVLDENELVDGVDELGVLLYGHKKNAYWFGSQLCLDEARKLAPNQNATGLQVTSAVLAGMVWALENPQAGIVEADEMDYRRCLEVQSPISGRSRATTRTGRRSRAAGPVPRGHRHQGPLAVPQHPRAITGAATRDCAAANLQSRRIRAIAWAQIQGIRTMTKAGALFRAACLTTLAGALAACTSVGPSGPGGGGMAARPSGPSVEGAWYDPNGLQSTFTGGVFETRTTDTGQKLADGSYRFDGRMATITVNSLVRNTTSSVNCAMVSPTQLNCTSSAGQNFVLTRRGTA
jgi:hypothetical protein